MREKDYQFNSIYNHLFRKVYTWLLNITLCLT